MRVKQFLPKSFPNTPIELEFNSIDELLSIDFIARAKTWDKFGDFIQYSMTYDKLFLIAEYSNTWAAIARLYGASNLDLPEYSYSEIPESYPLDKGKADISMDLFSKCKT